MNDEKLPVDVLDLIDDLLVQAFEVLSHEPNEHEQRRKQWGYSVEELSKKTSHPAAMAYLKDGLYDLYDLADCIRRKRSGEYTEM